MASGIPAITCAENIALLHLLHTVPVQPTTNIIDRSRVNTHGYTLSFDRERCLVGTLAFLSGITDNYKHISAVCVQQDAKSSALNVLLAVNKAKHDDNIQILRNIKEGYERILLVLTQLSNGEQSTISSNHSISLLTTPRQRRYSRSRE
jgi:hypothetical protein